MASLNDRQVRALLEPPNHAVLSSLNPDGSILSVVVWYSLEDDVLAVNSVRGRRWPSNLVRDPHVTMLVYLTENPGGYVEVEGTAHGTAEDAEEHTDRLAQRYLGQDVYPWRQPGEERIKFVISPRRVRYSKTG